MIAYHGSHNKFDKFNTVDVFLAKTKAEAMRYGPYVYEVEYIEPKFETNTILVVKPESITRVGLIERNEGQVIYRT